MNLVTPDIRNKETTLFVLYQATAFLDLAEDNNIGVHFCDPR
jgi:hypothetical protein